MASEYVRLSFPERSYGQKHFLQSELELLNLIKSFRTYKDLRKEELVLKVTLKNKIEQALDAVRKLSRLLPKSHYHESKKDKKEIKKDLSLQEEIDEVRAKLEKLQKNM